MFVEILYALVIQPIWLLLEIVFKIAYSICNNPGISIIFVSLVVNILVLPLYLKSDAIQSDERKKQKEMEGWIKHIRKNFKGDERFMVLSEYYRQNNYQPWYALKSSLSLLLQIPFFIAAYSFLSNLQLLHGVSFLFIKNLGLPDSIFSIGSFPINILPILMTAINLISAAVYTKGGPFREKIQTVGMALVFLVLLYNSPAGLVFYWTLNNLFSLGKNIVIYISEKLRRDIKKDGNKLFAAANPPIDASTVKAIWFSSSLFLTVLLGMVIPLSVISSSPLEFIQSGKFADPTRYAITTTAVSAGLFIAWGGVVFYLANRAVRIVYSIVCLMISLTALLNYLFFSRNFGYLWDNLVFSGEFKYSEYELLLNTLFIVQLGLIVAIVVRVRPRLMVQMVSILTVSSVVVGSYMAITSSQEVRDSDKYRASVLDDDHFDGLIRLSRNDKNVVIFVLDRAIGGYAPYILDEIPELEEGFDGFIYYPNTVSFGARTVQAAPAMYGGYDYSAYEINKRTNEPLKDKINQSLTLMPQMFSMEGYHSTVCDIPLGNLNGEGDQTIFDRVENCTSRILTCGAYWSLLTDDEKNATSAQQQKRNFFCYSLTKVAPIAIQGLLYDGGKYNSLSKNRVSNLFANSYAVMKNLSELTSVYDGPGELFIMQNYLTHEEAFLDPPDYILTSSAGSNDTSDKSRSLDGRTMIIENIDQLRHYEINVSAYLLLGKWFQTLKEQGVYDNTRIIIVADHGFDLGQFDDLRFEDIELDGEYVNPLLMVKDYDAHGKIKTDNSFMTNADVPSIAMKDVINDPINPYTGNPVNSSKKDEGPLIITTSRCWREEFHDETAYNPAEDHWYSIHDDIFDRDNWSIVEE